MPVEAVPWWRSSLFWRTFVLVGILLAISMGFWIASFHWLDRDNRAKNVSEQIASVVTITRAALVHSEPSSRQELIYELVSKEGIRIYPKEPSDQIEPLEKANDMVQSVAPYLQQKLGDGTVVSPKVNGHLGFWVSFRLQEDYADDVYWLRLDNGRFGGISVWRWLGWSGVVLVLSLIGAGFISKFLNQPLARLSQAARLMAVGKSPEALPESGITEIRDVNQSFNQMVQDLARVETDRAEILAGISHDLRTPLSRMMLEIEMLDIPEESRQGMQDDLSQMNAIVGQFLDYAKLDAETKVIEKVDLGALVSNVLDSFKTKPGFQANAKIQDGLHVLAGEIELRRMVNNILSNAIRYGKTPGKPFVEVDVSCMVSGKEVLMEIADHGVGVPEDSFERMLRPFTRMDNARGQANGSGLGLAIVARIAKSYQGRLHLKNREGGGLVVQVAFPLVKDTETA
ncbi:MAG: HAMP domain-containing protein [Oxalobacter sp.]|nr:HAMP domain-containing protein [Oxalobacter sp.]